MKNTKPFDLLLSLPPNMCTALPECEPHVAAKSFVTFDPPGQQLGSGGGTAYILEQAWIDSGEPNFDTWLKKSGKLIIHGGGEGRRLPPYAPAGKLFIPVPVFRWSLGQRLDQTLLDLAEPTLQKLAQASPSSACTMVASGDVLLRINSDIPNIPEADVVFFGLWVKPEEAQNFGVMFCEPQAPEKLVTFLQKPSPATIREQSRDHAFLIDVGIWLFSEKAIQCLMKQSGWKGDQQSFEKTIPNNYDLYGKWALSLGSNPTEANQEIGALTTAVVPLPDAGFYHVGTSTDLLDSLYKLQNLVMDQRKLGSNSSTAQPRQFVQNSVFQTPVRREENHSIWIENSYIPNTWKLSSQNILTGVPQNNWKLELEEGTCLDFVPVEDQLVLRVYGYADPSRGALNDEKTPWLGRPATEWFQKRAISLEEAGLDSQTDIQAAALFPLLASFDAEFIQWMFAENPETNDNFKEKWLKSRRFSAAQLGQQADLKRIYASRNKHRKDALPVLAKNSAFSVFHKLDLEATAQLYAESGHELPQQLDVASLHNPLTALHDCMFRSAVYRAQENPKWESQEKEAFHILRDLIVTRYKNTTSTPKHTLLDDQIVWGRCPVRLDFAGGWSDTPPYCLEHGGSVLNISIELNGQPPIQVFARRIPEHELVIRSIDLGLIERLTSYEDVRAYDKLGSGFALARAAFAITGFHPDFNGAHFSSLTDQLQQMGGGIELSMLAAVPKGSGLGTSSILAATLLGVLADFAGLNWDKIEISQRTLALEQMLTSGGGWQDQVGGIFPGIKKVKTVGGLIQEPIVRWLPDHFFHGSTKRRMLLYYTGITRVAHDVLGEVVRGIFLNSQERLNIIHQIKKNASLCHDAIQLNDFEAFADTVQQSWVLNKQLDSGTTTPAVEAILSTVDEELSAAKLLGAGGGGYLFMIAKDTESAERIKQKLTTTPPNPGARFVNFTLSETGLNITRS